jgi:hypothetical protein
VGATSFRAIARLSAKFPSEGIRGEEEGRAMAVERGSNIRVTGFMNKPDEIAGNVPNSTGAPPGPPASIITLDISRAKANNTVTPNVISRFHGKGLDMRADRS